MSELLFLIIFLTRPKFKKLVFKKLKLLILVSYFVLFSSSFSFFFKLKMKEPKLLSSTHFTAGKSLPLHSVSIIKKYSTQYMISRYGMITAYLQSKTHAVAYQL